MVALVGIKAKREAVFLSYGSMVVFPTVSLRVNREVGILLGAQILDC